MESLITRLNGDRAKRVQNKHHANASMLNLVQLFQKNRFLGIDRIAMLKYGIPDLRSFFDSDLRWLEHYGFSSSDEPSIHNGISR